MTAEEINIRKKIKDYFLSFTSFNQYRDFIINYQLEYLDIEKVLVGKEAYKKILQSLFTRGYIFDIKIRCNSRISFNDKIRNNDLLVLPEYVSENNFNVWTFNCTLDPSTNKYNIAHLAEQIYQGNIRPHNWVQWRTAICSDTLGTWVKRTDTNEDILKTEKGKFGINQHNLWKFFNPSLGCPVLESEEDYLNVFKPLLNRCTNPKEIICVVINQDYFIDELKII